MSCRFVELGGKRVPDGLVVVGRLAGKKLFLIPGESPIGLRLPLEYIAGRCHRVQRFLHGAG